MFRNKKNSSTIFVMGTTNKTIVYLGEGKGMGMSSDSFKSESNFVIFFFICLMIIKTSQLNKFGSFGKEDRIELYLQLSF